MKKLTRLKSTVVGNNNVSTWYDYILRVVKNYSETLSIVVDLYLILVYIMDLIST